MFPNNLITNPELIRLTMREVLKAEPEPPQEDIDFWNRFIGIARKWEQHFYSGYQGLDGVAKLFKRQGDDAVARINGKSKSYEPYDLVDWDRYEILFEEFGQLLLPLIAADYGAQELIRLNVGVSFDVLNPEVINFAEDYSVRFAKSVNQTTLDMLKKELTEADRLGEGIPQITKRIQALFTNMTKERAYMTARTEAMRAQNFGAEQGYIQSGVVEAKRWLAIDDLRTCFTKNTLIEMEGGVKPIQDIKIGDYVNTHLGLMQVINVIAKKHKGKMVKINLENSNQLICTPEHEIYESEKGWVHAKNLCVGDKLQTSKDEIIKIANLSYINFFKTYDNISKFFKDFIPLGIFNRIIMPILTICFETNIEGGQKKINTISFNLKFLNKPNIHSDKGFTNNFFKRCFSRISSIASHRAKTLSVFAIRLNSKFLSAVEAINVSSGSTTFLRAVFLSPLFIIKNLSTRWADGNCLEFPFAFKATNSISISNGLINSEGFVADRANFINGIDARKIITFIRAKLGIVLNITSILIRKLSAISADYFRTRDGVIVVALSRAIKNFGHNGLKYFSAIFTRSFLCINRHRIKITFFRAIFTIFPSTLKRFFAIFASIINHVIYLQRYYSKYIVNSQSLIVYDLTVEKAHSYYANGVLVHNCSFCSYMNGKILVLGGTWFEQGTSITLPKLNGNGTETFKFNYEAIKRPPAHPSDRCCLAPVVNEYYLR